MPKKSPRSTAARWVKPPAEHLTDDQIAKLKALVASRFDDLGDEEIDEIVLDVDGLTAIYLRECEAAKLAPKLGKSGLRILRRQFERVERKLNDIRLLILPSA